MFRMTADDMRALIVAMAWLSAAPGRTIVIRMSNVAGACRVDVRATRPTDAGGVSASLIEQPLLGDTLRAVLAEIAAAAREET